MLLPYPQDPTIPYPIGALATVFPNDTPMLEHIKKQWDLEQGTQDQDISKALSSPVIDIQTTSYVLDLASTILGICNSQSYPGESSLRLLSAAMKGKDILNLSPIIEGTTIATKPVLQTLFDHVSKESSEDLACSLYAYLGRSLAALTVAAAESYDVPDIGITGELVSHPPMISAFQDFLKATNHRMYLSTQVPPGDGGLSFGQAVAAAKHYTIE